MTYLQGFVLAVPSDRKDDYLGFAANAAASFRGYGASRTVEAWGVETPQGEVTDFYRAVQAEPGESVVFSWIEHEDKATRDAVYRKMMEDPQMQAMGAEMPMDGKRMIFGGFETVLDEGSGEGAGYIDGMMAPTGLSKAAFIERAAAFAPLVLERGALRVVDAWGDDVPHGKLTDMHRAVAAEPDETIAFCWIEWPSSTVRGAAWGALMDESAMGPETMPFDAKRAIFGGFEIIVDA